MPVTVPCPCARCSPHDWMQRAVQEDRVPGWMGIVLWPLAVLLCAGLLGGLVVVDVAWAVRARWRRWVRRST